MKAAKVDTLGDVILAECPEAADGTVVLRDARGEVTGYGRLVRSGAAFILEVSAAPEGIAVLTLGAAETL